MIQKRWLLLFLISLGQTACFLVGIALLTHWFDHHLRRVKHHETLAQNAQIASGFAFALEQRDPRAPETDERRLLQELVERVRLPNAGFLSVIDARTGDAIAHPDQDGQFAVLPRGLHRLTLETLSGPVKLINGEPPGALATPITGWIQSPLGSYYVAAADVPRLGAKVLAHQARNRIDESAARILSFVRKTALGIVLLALGCCSLLNVAIMRRYDNRLADSRDNETGEHLDRIRGYVELLVRELAKTDPAMNDEFLSRISFASSLHDIGKVGIPDAVLLKPGKLSAEERSIMQQHTLIGGDCLAAIMERLGPSDFLDIARQIALAHHERWDGKGYPYGLSGENIPVAARIVALADYYDALTSKRVYKVAMSHDEAKKIIVQEAGRQFDPRIVSAFLACEGDFRRIAEQSPSGPGCAPAYDEHLLNLGAPVELGGTAKSPWAGDLARHAATCARQLTADMAKEMEQQAERFEQELAELLRMSDEEPLKVLVTQVLEASTQLRTQLASAASKLESQGHRIESCLAPMDTDPDSGLLTRQAFERELAQHCASG